jgi:hypothetical protein
MRAMRTPTPTVEVLVGFAAGSDGRGIAYARLTEGCAKHVTRVEFRVSAAQLREEHGVGYAALTGVTRAVARCGVKRAAFVLADARFVEEVSTGNGVREALALSYVRLRCALNSFAESSVVTGATDDLTQRARAEVALNIAA